MKQQQIKALVKIADLGSIRAAAEALNTSQSSLTRAMRELEDSLGAQILNRSFRGVSFTPAGEALLRRARMIVETVARAEQEVRQISGGKGAKVAVAVTPVVAGTVLGDIYRQFKNQMPDATLVLTEGLLTSIVPGLIEGRLDFGIAIASQEALPSELVFKPLAQVLTAVAGREGHPLSGGSSWPELLSAPWVLNQSLGSSSNSLLDWLDSQDMPRPKEIVQCTSPQIMLEMMRRTDLIGLAPARYISDRFSGAGVELFKVRPLPPLLQLGVVRVRGAPLTPAAHLFETLVSRILQSSFAEELRAPDIDL